MDIDTKSNIKSLAINKEFERAIALKDKIEALQILRILVLRQDDTDIAPVEIKEKAIEKIASLYLQTKNEKKLPSILKDFSQFFASVSKAKTAKIVRNLLNTISKNSENAEMQLSFCDESIKWCQREKRSFLRQKIEARKAELLLEGRRYRDALAILRRLTSEAKQVDDKLYLIEVSLLDSQAHSVLGNLPVAKSSLVVARTTSNAVYCPRDLQAKLDLQSGNIALEEKDYKSSFSYYYESFENFNALNEKKRAMKPLKYMLLSKMLSGKANEIANLLKGRSIKQYQGEELDSMLQVSRAYEESSLETLRKVLQKYRTFLEDDKIIARNLKSVSDTLLEQNIRRIIEPYSCIEISFIAGKLQMDQYILEKTLTKLILDKKILGVIDQSKGHLILFKQKTLSPVYEDALAAIEQLTMIVTKLSQNID